MDSRWEQTVDGPVRYPSLTKSSASRTSFSDTVWSDADIAYPGQKRDIDFIATVLLGTLGMSIV